MNEIIFKVSSSLFTFIKKSSIKVFGEKMKEEMNFLEIGGE